MFANQLNALCARAGRTITNASLARSLTSRGRPISTVYLSQLRTGARTSPTSRVVSALAEHFDVPVDYFNPTACTETSNAVADPTLVDDLLDPSMRRLLACSQDLSATSTQLLTDFAQHLRAAEKLPSRCAVSAVR